jgi:hypothetical protein
VTLAKGYFDFNAAGMLPENAGRTATEVDTSLRQLKKEVK